jgi:RHS repeat-associated protein
MIDAAGAVYYYLNDHLGSAAVVINSSGTVRDKHKYQAFGGSDGGSVVLGQAYRYTGKPLDEELDLDWYYYGARYYDPSIGRFPSIDPLHGKYPGWSPYAYCLNNPLRLVDPDGRKVRYAPGVSGQFKQDFAKAIQKMNKDGTAGTFAKLEARPEIVYVGGTHGSNADFYAPGTRTITWDPNSALKTTGGGTQSPTTGLIHEGGHALRHLSDPAAFDRDRQSPDTQYDNKEERRVIEQVENPAARKAGEATRSDHGGTPYQVSGPTETSAITTPPTTAQPSSTPRLYHKN